MEQTWTLQKENVEKIISYFTGVGRKVDTHITWILFKNLYENKPIVSRDMTTVCDMFKSDLWNYGAVK